MRGLKRCDSNVTVLDNLLVGREHWSEEKVRTFSPPTREKAVLKQIAHYARPGGFGSVVSYDRVAEDLGVSPRTVRRHVASLVRRGELVSWCPLQGDRRSNCWFIPICAFTPSELEAMTGISRKQLRLPLVQRDSAAPHLIPDVGACPGTRDNLALGVGQGDPQTLPNINLTREGRKLLLEKCGVVLKSVVRNITREAEATSIEVASVPPAEWAEQMAILEAKVSADLASQEGTRWRDRKRWTEADWNLVCQGKTAS